METARIAELLAPYLPRPLGEQQLQQLLAYLDLLLRWNERVNLTAVRDPENIVTRHFGESLFSAACLFPGPHDSTSYASPHADIGDSLHLVDVGSGAGFPGIPVKLWEPRIRVTLIEANHKKVAFLREVSRTLTLTNINVFAGRAEDYAIPADAITLRAVERFETTLPIAAAMVAPSGRLALLIGSSQLETAASISTFQWEKPRNVPNSASRIVLIGQRLNEPRI